ncbi:MAG: hypothetical protein C0624_02795 [Desulfuromonas sp.]|nr:MAG: hypothetical protein C0624_02795 [Desulfuromonas sp.]
MKFKTQLSIGVGFFTTIVLIATALIISDYFIKKEIVSISERLKTIAEIVAISIDGDAHSRLSENGNYEDGDYRSIKNVLNKYLEITKSENVYDIYTMARSNNKHTLQFIVDVDTGSTASEFREDYDTSDFPLMEAAFNQPKAEYQLLEDKFGTWLSAYAPIYNAAGKYVGIVGVDASAESVHHVQNTIISHITVITFLALIITVPLSWFISGFISKRLQQLTEFAEQIKDGHYAHDEAAIVKIEVLASQRKDEIGFLALTMSHMAEKVAEREAHLKEKIKSLHIEIDEQEKKKQVDELEDSELFQTLLNRSRNPPSAAE